MEVSLLPILMLYPDVSGQIHYRLETERANLLDSLVNGLNVRLEGLAGCELCSAVLAFVSHLFLVRSLFMPLELLSRVKRFFTELALKS